jgi:colanic acid/amylovoran biosynthesis glycosyltransferase
MQETMPKEKLHIMYILRSFPTVTEMSTLNEISGMVRRGVEVSIVSLKKPASLSQLHRDVEKYKLQEKVYYLNVSTGIRKWKNIFLRTVYGQLKLWLNAKADFSQKCRVSLFSIRKKNRRLSLVHLVDLINHIQAKKPDVIYFHFAVHAGELIILRRIFNIPVIVFFHGFDFSMDLPFRELNYPEMFRRGDWFFANSRFSGKKVEALGCPPEKLSVVGLPVDDENYPYKVRTLGDHPKLLTVARLVEKKGLKYSIEAVARLVAKYPALEYTIIGEGPLQADLEKLIHSLGMEKNIILSGSKKKEEVIEYMLASHIFILASVTAENGDTEGLGMVLLESQLSGMPVLATQHNGFTDAVDDGRSGFLVPEKDVDALYEKLNWLLENPASWEAMGKAGREHVLKNFSEDVYMRKILDKLNSLLFSF